MLYQLSYTPSLIKVVGLGGLGLPTSRLSGVRSNHLSYKPVAVLETDARTIFDPSKLNLLNLGLSL